PANWQTTKTRIEGAVPRFDSLKPSMAGTIGRAITDTIFINTSYVYEYHKSIKSHSMEGPMKTNKHQVLPALAFCLAMIACTVPAWVNSVEADAKVAAPIAASLIDVIDPALAPAVTLVVSGFNALVKTLDDYKAGPTGTNLQAVESAFNAVNE